MKNKTRWIVSIATGIAAVPAAYAASVMLCAGTTFGSALAVTGALSLIP